MYHKQMMCLKTFKVIKNNLQTKTKFNHKIVMLNFIFMFTHFGYFDNYVITSFYIKLKCNK